MKKIYYFEYLRCFGALAVVLLHVFQSTMVDYGVTEVGIPLALMYSGIQILFTQWAVPVFFMITGALLLDPKREMPFKKIGKYCFRMAMVLLTFGLLFCLMESVWTNGVTLAAIGIAFLNLLSGESWGHLWYIYALVGLYLLLPLFRGFVQNSEKKDILTMVVILFVFTLVVPTINYTFEISLDTFIWLTSSAFYFLAGYYLHTYVNLDAKIAVCGIVSMVIVLAITALSIVGIKDYGAFYRTPSSLFMAVWSAFFFLAGKQFLNRQPGKTVAWLASLSFGIYIIHPLFLNILFKMFHWFPGVTLPCGLFETVAFVFALGGSVVCTALLKKIPFFARIL